MTTHAQRLGEVVDAQAVVAYRTARREALTIAEVVAEVLCGPLRERHVAWVQQVVGRGNPRTEHIERAAYNALLAERGAS